MGTAAVPSSARLRVERREIRHWLGTTPGRLRLLSGVVVVVVAMFGAVAIAATAARTDTIRAISLEHERALDDASQAYVALSDGDATAAAAFLAGGAEPAQQRDQYSQDITTANERLASLAAGGVGSPTATSALKTIDDQLPRYAGLVGQAKANNRLGYPVGAAYLRDASTLMREQILPALLVVYRFEATQLQASYRSATSGTALAVVLAAGLVAMAVMAFAQIRLWRRSHRVFNIGLLLATATVVVAVAYTAASLVIQQHRLEASRLHGSDEVVVLSSAQILALRARADEGLALGARGGAGSAQYFVDFKAVDEQLEGVKGVEGLLPEAQRLTASTSVRPSIDELAKSLQSYVLVHDDVEKAAKRGDTDSAIAQAKGAGEDAFGQLNARFMDATAQANDRFSSEVSGARRALARTQVVVLISTLLAAGLVLLGLRSRIREYR